jgi:flagellin-like hook-associated protein FlgL
MGRIGATISGIERTLLNRAANANAAAAVNLLRLATLEKINSPKDDPSGFVTLSRARGDQYRVRAALDNVTAASSVVSAAQLAIDQIRAQLVAIRSKALEDQDQGLTSSGRTANQTAIDAAIIEINRLATSETGGRRLLDGSADFYYAGINGTQIADVRVFAKGHGTAPTISGTVSTAATQAELVTTDGSSQISADAVFTLTGDRGATSISVTNGESFATVATRINDEAHLTGVTATVDGTNLRLGSIDYGSNADVVVSVTSGTFTVTGGNGNGAATGSDAVATIGGIAVTGDGNTLWMGNNGFRAAIELVAGFTGALDTVTVSGDALTFALTSEPRDKVTLAIAGLQSARLGGLSGSLDSLQSGGSAAGLGSNAPLAIRIVDEAIADLDLIEGQVDGFSTAVLDSSSNLMTALETEAQATIDAIILIDVNEESQLLAYNQGLASNAIAGLAIMQQQRESIVALIQQIAGF